MYIPHAETRWDKKYQTFLFLASFTGFFFVDDSFSVLFVLVLEDFFLLWREKKTQDLLLAAPAYGKLICLKDPITASTGFARIGPMAPEMSILSF